MSTRPATLGMGRWLGPIWVVNLLGAENRDAPPTSSMGRFPGGALKTGTRISQTVGMVTR